MKQRPKSAKKNAAKTESHKQRIIAPPQTKCIIFIIMIKHGTKYIMFMSIFKLDWLTIPETQTMDNGDGNIFIDSLNESKFGNILQ